MANSDYVMTIDSDSDDFHPPVVVSTPTMKFDTEDGDLNPEFVFDISGDPYIDAIVYDADFEAPVKKSSKPESVSVDSIIARRRLSRKRKRESSVVRTVDHVESSDEADQSDGSSENDVTSDSDDGEEHSIRNEQGLDSCSSDSEFETQTEKDRKAAFFDPAVIPSKVYDSFLAMSISRPILKALNSLGFYEPTPIQAAAIPVGLLGKDVVGGAVTGSGKTAAFIIPMLERLLYREKGKSAAATRCLVLVPTRELAVQCHDVATKLATHTDIRSCLIVGGVSIKSQEVALRTRPDIIIATPGRLIDHIHNTPSFTLDALDVLVLDEADRMLSDGFADELAEIIKTCPTSRQTMLFSATMTDSVDELVKMSLNHPVRLFVDPKRSMARGLVQEFVRIRAGKETERSALLVSLCKRTFRSNVIIFFRSKKLVHQMRVVFGLLGLKCEELHGDLSQEQRLKALHHFRGGSVDFLMATDLASRGLDIKGVETVINYDMPGQLAQYLHRVGRTARAGTKGRSVTLVGEGDRKMLRAAIKKGAGEDQVRHRIVPPEVVSKWSQTLDSLKEEVSAVLRDEKQEKQLQQAEMELRKGENMIKHEAEIHSRPAKTWFQTGSEKQRSKVISKQQHETGVVEVKSQSGTDGNKPKRDKFSGLSRKAKRRKMTLEEDKEFGDSGGLKAAIRSAKRSGRPSKINFPASERTSGSSSNSRAKKGKVTAGTKSAFARDFDGQGRKLKARTKAMVKNSRRNDR